MDFIFTVRDQAAGELCPAWPGQPVTAHWDFADPSKVAGEREVQLKAFKAAQSQIANRIRLFLSLPIDKLDRASLERKCASWAPQSRPDGGNNDAANAILSSRRRSGGERAMPPASARCLTPESR